MTICRSDKEAIGCKHVELCRKGCHYQIVNGIQGQARNKEGQLYMFVCIKDAKKFQKAKKLYSKHKIVPVLVNYDEF